LWLFLTNIAWIIPLKILYENDVMFIIYYLCFFSVLMSACHQVSHSPAFNNLEDFSFKWITNMIINFNVGIISTAIIYCYNALLSSNSITKWWLLFGACHTQFVMQFLELHRAPPHPWWDFLPVNNTFLSPSVSTNSTFFPLALSYCQSGITNIPKMQKEN